MSGKIYRYLSDDHLKLDDALRRATSHPGTIDMPAYAEFREGLLRHIMSIARSHSSLLNMPFAKPATT
jgi:hypothetical protein